MDRHSTRERRDGPVRFEERWLVRHRGAYWGIAEDTEVEMTLTAMTTTRAATDRLGPEVLEEWGTGVDSADEWMH